MIRDTSLEAYQTVEVSDKQRIVLHYICSHYPCTDVQIAHGLGWTINRVTPRRGELETLGLIIDAGYTVQQSGRRAHIWKPKPRSTPTQSNLFG